MIENSETRKFILLSVHIVGTCGDGLRGQDDYQQHQRGDAPLRGVHVLEHLSHGTRTHCLLTCIRTHGWATRTRLGPSVLSWHEAVKEEGRRRRRGRGYCCLATAALSRKVLCRY